MNNAYDILGIKPGADDKTIKEAWIKMAMNNHPDRGGSTERMQEINKAYEMLSEIKKCSEPSEEYLRTQQEAVARAEAAYQVNLGIRKREDKDIYYMGAIFGASLLGAIGGNYISGEDLPLISDYLQGLHGQPIGAMYGAAISGITAGILCGTHVVTEFGKNLYERLKE